MRFLCVSDIHGHAHALRRVLEEKAVCVQGLVDRAIATIDPTRVRAATADQKIRIERLVKAKHELGELIVARLGKLPPTARLPLESGDELVVVHGSPADPSEPFTADMTDDELRALVGDDPADIIVCGGSHVPFHRQLDGTHIINVGSVGEAPGGKTAHGTLLDAGRFGVVLDQFEVEL
jgi:predicted phosphodiesterase